MVDETKLNAFIGKMLGDLGGAFSVPMVRMGDKLGLYKALKEQGSMRPEELAAKTKVAERYAREWLSHQASSGYLEYDSATGKFAFPPEQAMVFADVDSPVYLQGGFRSRGGDGRKPAESRGRVSLRRRASAGASRRSACSAPWDASSARAITTTWSGSWLPALDAVAEKLERGATVADVGCGHGFSTIIMAKAFPKSTFIGYDFHPASVEQARIHAEPAWSDREHEVRGRHGERFSGQGPGPSDVLRLPA